MTPAESPITVQLVALAFDAMAPRELARFWAHALRWTIREAGGLDVELVPTDATSFHVLFRPVAREKVGQNRIHFDLTTTSLDDQHTMVAELLAIGGEHIDIGQDPNASHVVLADPEGNEFCIIEPYNSFLASCPRLGAVNCDGTQALGYFWSAALGWPLVDPHPSPHRRRIPRTQPARPLVGRAHAPLRVPAPLNLNTTIGTTRPEDRG